jgi:polar amino acid transport system substrate-binding protein
MKWYSLINIVSLCLFFFSRPILAEEHLTLYAVDYPPFVVVSRTGGISGSDVEIVKAAFQSQGIKVNIEVLPWVRITKLMQHGAIAGTFPCSKRSDRMDYMIFSDVLSTPWPAVIARKTRQLSDVHKLEDLRRYKVVSVLGWGVEKQLTENDIVHSSVLDIRTALANVIFRDVDAFYNTVDSSLPVARSMQVDKQLQIIYLNDIPKLNLHLCLSEHYPQSRLLLKTFNKGMQQIKEEGKYEAIRNDFSQ